ncbi:hypothetical protein [Endozoicomonas sp.]|uniref:hypothetical protein n=1 Tax=Endozoicomonas sp. TaxID=1892382 RepID=UPI002883D715|nr:hypothetical protein [Endozoicomonas sp.]
MTRIRSMQQDEWDDAFWNGNHEHRKAKAQKSRHKGVRSSAISQGIEDYFKNSRLKKTISEHYQDIVDYGEPGDIEHKPRI